METQTDIVQLETMISDFESLIGVKKIHKISNPQLDKIFDLADEMLADDLQASKLFIELFGLDSSGFETSQWYKKFQSVWLENVKVIYSAFKRFEKDIPESTDINKMFLIYIYSEYKDLLNLLRMNLPESKLSSLYNRLLLRISSEEISSIFNEYSEFHFIQLRTAIIKRVNPREFLESYSHTYELLMEKYFLKGVALHGLVSKSVIKNMIIFSADPVGELEAKCTIFDSLVDKYLDVDDVLRHPFANLTVIKSLVLRNADPEGVLLSKFETFDYLVSKYFDIDDAAKHPLISIGVIRFLVLRSADPERDLLAKFETFDYLVSKYFDIDDVHPFTNMTVLKFLVLRSADPEGDLLAKIKVYNDLVKVFPDDSYLGAIIISALNQNISPSIFRIYVDRALKLKEHTGYSMKLCLYQSVRIPLSDDFDVFIKKAIPPIEKYIKFLQVVHPISLDKTYSNSDLGLYGFLPDPGNDFSSDAKAQIEVLIKDEIISPKELEALYLYFIDDNFEDAANILECEIQELDSALKIILERIKTLSAEPSDTYLTLA